MTESYDITTDSELQTAVRTETGYDSNNLSTADLSNLIDSAKRVMALKADVSNFYSDRGLAVALLGVTAAKAKGAVENSPVRVKNLAGQDVTFRDSDGGSLQLAQYEEMTELGLRESNNTEAGPQKMRLTGTYLSDSSTF